MVVRHRRLPSPYVFDPRYVSARAPCPYPAFAGTPDAPAPLESSDGRVLSYPNARIERPGLVIVVPPATPPINVAQAVETAWWKGAVVQGFAQALTFAAFGVAVYLFQRAQGKDAEFQLSSDTSRRL